MPEQYFVSRLGGDEIVVLALLAEPETVVEPIAQTLIAVARQPIFVEPHWCTLSASVGVAIARTRDVTADMLLRDADIAMYRAKDAGRNTFRTFEASMARQDVARLQLRSELPGAMDNRQFAVHYQPIMDVRTQHVISREMLLRWNHPKRGLITAGEFIAELDTTGLSEPITQFVLETGLSDHASALRNRQTRIALNMWPRSLRRPEFLSDLVATLTRFKIAPSQLEIELTEGEFVNAAQSMPKTIDRIIAQGIRILIDDFGKGFSNFGYLTRFPVHAIKIDQEFVAGIGKNPRSEKLIKAIIGLANDLGIETIGEGVETQAQSVFLILHGCVQQQGYFFGRPSAHLASTDAS